MKNYDNGLIVFIIMVLAVIAFTIAGYKNGQYDERDVWCGRVLNDTTLTGSDSLRYARPPYSCTIL